MFLLNLIQFIKSPFICQLCIDCIKSISNNTLFFNRGKYEFLFHEIILLKVEACATLSQRINEFTKFC